MSKNGSIEMDKKYFSLRTAAHDNAIHIYQPEMESYIHLLRRNIQMFRKWASESNIDSIKIHNKFYVLFDTYNLLVDIVRNNHAIEYLGISKATLSRLKKDGILNKLSIPKTKTSFLSFRQISDSATIRLIEARRRKGNRHKSIISIDRLKYYDFK